MISQEGLLHTCSSFSASGASQLHSWHMGSYPSQKPVKTSSLSACVVDACPNLEDETKLCALLYPDETIGVHLKIPRS